MCQPNALAAPSQPLTDLNRAALRELAGLMRQLASTLEVLTGPAVPAEPAALGATFGPDDDLDLRLAYGPAARCGGCC